MQSTVVGLKSNCKAPECVLASRAGGYCDRHYRRWRKYGDPRPAHLEGTVEQRFWRRVDVSAGPNSCWLWTKAISPYGYGKLTYRGRVVAAHRVAFELAVGPIPDGLQVDHLCHTLACTAASRCVHRRCVNPAHLRATSARENTLRSWAPSAVNARLESCRRGHAFSDGNIYWEAVSDTGRLKRHCVQCRRLAQARRRPARRSGA